MKLVLRYLLYAVGAIIAFVVYTVSAHPDARFTMYVPGALMAGTAAIILLTVIALWTEDDLTEQGKGWLLRGIMIAVLLPTVFTTGAFLHEAQTTWTKGEVHYHADFEVVADGEQLNLINPSQFCKTMTRESEYMCSVNDRVGTTEYHEHNDNRIHLEGVFKTKEEASLAAFFEAFHGELTDETLRFPTNDGWVNVTEHDEKTLKVLIMRGVGKARGWCVLGENVSAEDTCIDPYGDQHVTNPVEYVISPHQQDPKAGDLSKAVLDKIWIIYDDTSAADALQDLREDNAYTHNGETFQMTKGGEGYE